jgi:hypothetical protein
MFKKRIRQVFLAQKREISTLLQYFVLSKNFSLLTGANLHLVRAALAYAVR